MSGKYREFPCDPCPMPARPPPLLAFLPTACLLQLVNIPWHIIITHSVQFIYIRVHSWGCTVYRFGHMYNDVFTVVLSYRITSQHFKIFYALYIHPPSHQTTINHSSFPCIHSYTYRAYQHPSKKE